MPETHEGLALFRAVLARNVPQIPRKACALRAARVNSEFYCCCSDDGILSFAHRVSACSIMSNVARNCVVYTLPTNEWHTHGLIVRLA